MAQETTVSSIDFDHFKGTVARAYVPLDVSTLDAEQFSASVRGSKQGQNVLSTITADSHRVARTDETISAGEEFIKLNLTLAGYGILKQDNRELVMEPGSLALYDTRRPYSLEFDRRMSAIVLMFPRKIVEMTDTVLAQFIAQPLAREARVGQMVVAVLGELEGLFDIVESPVGGRLIDNTIDFATTMLIDEIGRRRLDGDPRSEVMRTVVAYIDSHLHEADLDPTKIAAAHFVSLRYLHGLFREHGCSVASTIRERRLERCRRDLGDPMLARVPISRIAARWGLLDPPHFSKLFRAEFGCAPTRYREQSCMVLA